MNSNQKSDQGNKQSGSGNKQSGSASQGGKQGGTHEQHVEAGRQSHKNDGNKQSGSGGSKSGKYWFFLSRSDGWKSRYQGPEPACRSRPFAHLQIFVRRLPLGISKSRIASTMPTSRACSAVRCRSE